MEIFIEIIIIKGRNAEIIPNRQIFYFNQTTKELKTVTLLLYNFLTKNRTQQIYKAEKITAKYISQRKVNKLKKFCTKKYFQIDIAHNSLHESFINFQIEAKKHTLSKKKIYQEYCENKKKKILNFQTVSLHKQVQLPEPEDQSFSMSKKIINPKLIKERQKERKKSQQLNNKGIKTNILRNTTRSHWTTNEANKIKKIGIKGKKQLLSSAQFIKNKPIKNNALLGQNQIKEIIRSDVKQQKQNKNGWVIDPWQQDIALEDFPLLISNIQS